MIVAWGCLLLVLGLAVYTYGGYPMLLLLIGRIRPAFASTQPIGDWPSVTVAVPAYNEEATIAATIDNLLRLDYPRDRLQILVVSDASTDRTDEIVRGYEGAGVGLLRVPQRSGKTTAENLARRHATGAIVVNTDASVQVLPHALKPLIAAFADPEVAVASGRDISISGSRTDDNGVEAGYVGYEMWVRRLETAAGGIIGTSGCFFATRAAAIEAMLPGGLSWDFAAPLLAKERGYRSVSVPAAVCHVPRTDSVAREYRRKVRTVARGIQTLAFKKHLLNPFRYGAFAWMLFSHKICRWALPWGGVAALGALGVLASGGVGWAQATITAAGVAILLGVIGWRSPRAATLRPVSLAAFLVAGNVAVLHAALRAVASGETPTWEPTRRGDLPATVPGVKR